MKPPREFGPLPHARHRPELSVCPHRGGQLRYSHEVWAKPIQSLRGIEYVTNLGVRCENPACRFPRTGYRSARAEACQVKGSGYGLDVVAEIGHRRFGEHRTREEIWRYLDEATPVRISKTAGLTSASHPDATFAVTAPRRTLTRPRMAAVPAWTAHSAPAWHVEAVIEGTHRASPGVLFTRRDRDTGAPPMPAAVPHERAITASIPIPNSPPESLDVARCSDGQRRPSGRQNCQCADAGHSMT